MSQKLLMFFLIALFHSTATTQQSTGNYVNLSGKEQYIEIPDMEYLNYGSDKSMTIELLFKPDSSEAYSLIHKWKPVESVYKYSNFVGTGYLFHLNIITSYDTEKYKVQCLDPLEGFYKDNTWRGLLLSSQSMSITFENSQINTRVGINSWNHLAFVFNEDGNTYVYINGSIAYSKRYITGRDFKNPGYPLCIGGYPQSIADTLDNSYYFKGDIDEVRVWNFARSRPDIVNTMNTPLDSNYFNSAESGLVAYYRFEELQNLGVGDDNLANDIYDYSVNHNHAEIKGGGIVISGNSIPKINSAIKITSSNSDELTRNKPEKNLLTFDFSLPQSGNVVLDLYNEQGEKVQNIVDNYYEPGYHQIVWSSENVPDGLYECRMLFREVENSLSIKIEK